MKTWRICRTFKIFPGKSFKKFKLKKNKNENEVKVRKKCQNGILNPKKEKFYDVQLKKKCVLVEVMGKVI